MKRAPKSINIKQLSRLYWPSWNAAKKVLIGCHHSKEDAEEVRKSILEKQGVDSSKLLNNRQLDEVLKAHAAIADPRNGKLQAQLADQALKRVRFRIAESAKQLGYTEENVEGVSQQMFRRPIAQLTEVQLIKVSQALNTHAERQKTFVHVTPVWSNTQSEQQA